MTEDLNKMTTEELGLLFPVILVDYDPSWVKIYLHEKENILKALRQYSISGIEHIGSTAIPGICSKPTIDILLEIPYDTDTDFLIRDLKGIQYQYIPKPENPPPHIILAKGYSKKGYTGQTFHIHIRYAGYRDEVIFRDYLYDNPDIAQQYDKLKKELSIRYRNDREKYTEGKTEFIKQIMILTGNKRTK